MENDQVGPEGPAPAEDEQDRSLEEAATAAQQFLTGVTRLGMDLKLGQDAAVLLFGVFARKCVDMRVKKGCQRDKETMSLMTAFMKGMGMDMVVQQADEEEAAALEAEIQRRKGTIQ